MLELTGLDATTLFLAFCVAIVAGIVKGAVGFAMPLVLVSGLSTIMEPRLALAGLILPTLASNALQVVRAGFIPAREAMRTYWRYVLVVCIAIVIVAQGVALLPGRAFYFAIGIPVLGLSLVQLAGWRPVIAPDRQRRAEWIAGLISGVLGGIAGTWGPVTVLFLLATKAPKVRQMAVQGVIYGTGSAMLLAGHLHSGLFNRETAPLSAMLLIPAGVGMWAGFRLQDRMDAERFRRATLIVLAIAGLNFLRRGFFG